MLSRYLIVLCCSILFSFASSYTQYTAHANMQELQQDPMSLLRQCADGITNSCSLLLGRGIPSVNECDSHVCHIVGATLSANGNDKEAIPYLQKSCQSNENLGCTLLGLLYQLHGNISDAETMYNIACNNGDVIGCYNMGVLQSTQLSLHMRGHAALQSFARACSMQYPQACFNLAVIYANYKKDSSNALYFFHVACDYGIAKACKNAQLLKKNGVILPTLQKKRGLYIKSHDFK